MSIPMHEIKLQDIWVASNLVKSDSARVQFVCLFRFLLFCDQCHDFLENVKRNEWRNQRRKVYEELVNSYNHDMTWLQGQFPNYKQGVDVFNSMSQVKELLTIKPPSQKTGKDVNGTYPTTETLVKVADELLQVILGIAPTGGSSVLLNENDRCSKYIERFLSIISTYAKMQARRVDNLAATEAVNEFLLTVDADSSKVNYASLINYICDKVTSGQQYKLNMVTTIATRFDSASGSKVMNHFTKLAKEAPGIEMKDEDPCQSSCSKTMKLTFFGIPLLEFTYTQTKPDNKIYLTLNSCFSKTIYDRGLGGDKTFDPSNLTILGNPPGGMTIAADNASVHQLTSAYQMKTLTGDPNDETPILVDDCIWFKTLGDLGQILRYYLVEAPPYEPKFFITFDQMCSRISALFLRYTIFESQNDEDIMAPLTFFVDTAVPPAMSLINLRNQLTPEMAALDRQQAAAAMTDFYLQGRVGFGRKTNKLRNMSDKTLKEKLKSVGIHVTKLSSRGKRLPLTRRQLEQKANMFRNLQIKAQKLNIRLMYKSKNRGYVYKSYNRLVNDIERLKMKLKKNKKRSKFGG